MTSNTDAIWMNRAKKVLLIRVLVGWVFLSEGIQKFLFPAAHTADSDRTEFLPTTAQADQKSSMGATWPEPEASRASLVTSAAPSFSASTM